MDSPATLATDLVAIQGILKSARAVLAECDCDVAIPECLRLLREVEDKLNLVASDFAHDPPISRSLRSLRDEVAGYVLATQTLQDVGVKPTVVVALLHRGVDLANATI